MIRRLEILTHLKQFYVEDFEHLHIAVKYLDLNDVYYRLMMRKEISSTLLRDSDLSGTSILALILSRLSPLKKHSTNNQRSRERWNSPNYTLMFSF